MVSKRKKNKHMDYGWQQWLDSLDQKTGSVKEYPGSKARWLKPKDIDKYAGSLTPEELYMKDKSPIPLMHSYPTTAVNISEPPWLDQEKNATALFAAEADPRRDMHMGWQDNDNAQGVYEHEVAHERDPRRDKYKMWSFPNHGFTTYNGFSGGLLQREFPAMVAEEKFRRERDGI